MHSKSHPRICTHTKTHNPCARNIPSTYAHTRLQAYPSKRVRTPRTTRVQPARSQRKRTQWPNRFDSRNGTHELRHVRQHSRPSRSGYARLSLRGLRHSNGGEAERCPRGRARTHAARTHAPCAPHAVSLRHEAGVGAQVLQDKPERACSYVLRYKRGQPLCALLRANSPPPGQAGPSAAACNVRTYTQKMGAPSWMPFGDKRPHPRRARRLVLVDGPRRN